MESWDRPGSSFGWDPSLTSEVNREENPGDWTSVCMAEERGRRVLLGGRERGRGDEEQVPGGGEGLGPIPSFSLRAGERMEVKVANIFRSFLSYEFV